MSYLAQWEALERACLSQIALLPHLEEDARKGVPMPDQVKAEFDAWLLEPPPNDAALTHEERRQADLYRLLGVGGRR